MKLTGINILRAAAFKNQQKKANPAEEYFGSQLFVHPRHSVQSSIEAARLYFRCRKKGITLRSTIDCLIAQIAIEHNLFLLHDDRDFAQTASVEPKLKFSESLLR